MPIDLKWMSQGGVLLDGGDIALCDPLEGIKDMVRTRLKAALNAWKLYAIGADLEDFIGNAISDELEVSLRRQVVNASRSPSLRPLKNSPRRREASPSLRPPANFRARGASQARLPRLRPMRGSQIPAQGDYYLRCWKGTIKKASRAGKGENLQEEDLFRAPLSPGRPNRLLLVNRQTPAQPMAFHHKVHQVRIHFAGARSQMRTVLRIQNTNNREKIRDFVFLEASKITYALITSALWSNALSN